MALADKQVRIKTFIKHAKMKCTSLAAEWPQKLEIHSNRCCYALLYTPEHSTSCYSVKRFPLPDIPLPAGPVSPPPFVCLPRSISKPSQINRFVRRGYSGGPQNSPSQPHLGKDGPRVPIERSWQCRWTEAVGCCCCYCCCCSCPCMPNGPPIDCHWTYGPLGAP